MTVERFIEKYGWEILPNQYPQVIRHHFKGRHCDIVAPVSAVILWQELFPATKESNGSNK